MKTIYIDFDNTMVESNKKVIDILNSRYGLRKTEDDLLDYGYNSIVPISNEEKLGIFESDEFFNNLELKKGMLDIMAKYYNSIQFVVTTKGTALNLEKKKAWIKEHIPFEIDFIGITNDSLSKNSVDMCDGVQIDDCTAALDTNAPIKILYKDGHDFEWQRDYTNQDILVVNTWEQIDEILSFYSTYDYVSLQKRRA